MKATQVWKDRENNWLRQDLFFAHGHFFYKWKPLAIEQAILQFWDKAKEILKKSSIYYLKTNK